MCRHDNLGCIKQTTSMMAVDVRCRLDCDDMLLQALMEGIALADFQTFQDRGRGAVLVTTLAHSSDQWIASEVRIASPVDRRPSLGYDRTTPTALIYFTNSLHEVAYYRRRWRAILRALFPRKINSLSRPSSWHKLGFFQVLCG
jgi:hypothetical protein